MDQNSILIISNPVSSSKDAREPDETVRIGLAISTIVLCTYVGQWTGNEFREMERKISFLYRRLILIDTYVRYICTRHVGV